MEQNERMLIEERIAKTFNSLSENGTVTTARKELRSNLETIRTAYESLRGMERKEGWQQWLSDNFYALDGHAKQSLLDLKGYRKKSTGLFWLLRMLTGVFAPADLAINGETLELALERLNDKVELTERQFDFVYTALKCILIHIAALACSGDYQPKERERMLSYAVVNLSKIYEVDFDGVTSRCSTVESILCQDPSGIYEKMVPQSRRHYRCVVARIAGFSGEKESAVAHDVLSCAQNAAGEREKHVGYYLLRHDPQIIRARRKGLIALTMAYVAPVFLCVLIWMVTGSVWTALISYLPLVEIVRILASNIAMRGVPVNHIPRIALKGDKPKTVVAISTLLPDAAKATELRSRLEQLYFSNLQEHLYFCVLADFKEDKRPFNPQDELRIDASKRVVEKLNAQYGNHFMLFVRKRTFNKTQNRYSGWERKRGAITEFIRFMKGGKTSVTCFVGDETVLPEIRYMIALDSDTNLSFESAEALISAAEHPLNRPVIGKHNVVTSGYGVLVPRIGVDLDSAKATDFTRVMAGAGGVATYEQECSDFYQDLFGEAIFSGKGLIDIEAFHTVVSRRFPENEVLSHDILEGAYLRTGLLSDVEMTDGMPTNTLSWFIRLHRWLRGDWQNLRYFKRQVLLNGVKRVNPISPLSKYKLFDNLRRSLVCPAALVCVISACFVSHQGMLILCALAFFSIALSPLIGAVKAFTNGGRFALTRRYFARTLPRTFELLGQALFSIVMLAQQAVVTVDAVGRTLWRMFVSKKNLLQWTTAAQGEIRQISFFAALRCSWISELLGLVLLIFAPTSRMLVKLFGLLFLLYVPLAVISARQVQEPKTIPSRTQREQLLSWCVQMFSFYEDYANAENNYLPPDNVQFSPTNTVAKRTSPTNIGMMLLSYLAARDLNFIDSAGLALRLSRTFDTIKKLETYYGNLYNWYATDDLRVLPEKFVSSVDSGNYLCALVALKEGLQEYAPQEPKLAGIIETIERILKQTDFGIFYSKSRKLLSIGIGQDGKQSGSHYDFLMSEARTASYFAIATRQVQYKHWRALSRIMSRSGAYAGPISWTGTMFEYFMPHLLLPVYEGSLLSEALHYALYCQKKRTHTTGIPWGISESGYFAFDEHLNYQYKAHGVQALGVKQGLNQECVVAPYASFLCLPFDLDEGMKNLKRLEEYGLIGRYGFYEAADFTPQRCRGAGYAVVRSYMAHHVGMSLVACANTLLDNVMQKRFMRDHAMRSAKEFLQEKISKDAVVYDQMKENEKEPRLVGIGYREIAGNASALDPACTFLSNGQIAHFFADSGVSWLRYSDTDVTRRTFDPLLHGQGVLGVVRMCGQVISATESPFYQRDVSYRYVYGKDNVAYLAQKGEIELEERFTIDRARPIERVTLTIRNRSSIKAMAEVLFYLEPILARNSEYAAHPAFSKLFLLGERDPATDTVTFFRRHRDGSEGLYLTVAFAENYAYDYLLRREAATPYPDGLDNLLHFSSLPFDGGSATPDGCCALRLMEMVPAHGETQVTLLLSVASTLEESVGNAVSARETPVEPVVTPALGDTMPAQYGLRVLPKLLFPLACGKEDREALAKNNRGQDALWSLGISGDLPVVLYEWQEKPDADSLRAYAELWQMMRLNKMEFDLCVLGTPDVSLPEGIRVIDPQTCTPDTLVALHAAAVYAAGGEDGSLPGDTEWEPMQILASEPSEIPQGEGRFDVVGGAFVNRRFYVERVTPLPFSHILANRSFGCLLGDSSLGNSWWENARECKLTPWNNDIAAGNDGERLLLRIGDEMVYDLCKGSRASFSKEGGWYEGTAGNVAFAVSITIPENASVKYIDLTLENRGEEEASVMCAYYLEPVLGVSRLTSKYVQFTQRDACVVMHNPYNMAVSCYAAVHVPDNAPIFTTDRAAFFAGDWTYVGLLPNNDPILGTVVPKKLPPRRKEKVRFILSAAATEDSAVKLATEPVQKVVPVRRRIEISTPDEPLNRFINEFAPHQIEAGRLFGRCAFYQCSGAYGFRDQLQDAAAYRIIDPQVTREQIARCCAVQFEEGDVLHWWHPLPDVTCGVRTRFSDDLLWLPFVVCDYIETTGDYTLLDEQIAYCKGDLLQDGEQERYLEIQPSDVKGSVFDHCIRAIEHAWNLGDKGIPKIGCGDWNDGFSKVGAGGEGQSVWLGMFMAIVLKRFAELCEWKKDSYRASVFRGNAALLKDKIDENCWDGKWYLRAFYDDGEPVGSHRSDECQIDLLSQSFSVLCGMPDEHRVTMALQSALHRLVDEDYQIIRLFTPPFDRSKEDPGYIKSYPKGIRENGGQYTHAAVWFALALLENGQTDEGYRLLNMMNPVARCTEAKIAQAFKTEPYYIPADIYTHEGCYAHGGWSIYTGAAAWYYRTVIETLLGFHFLPGKLDIAPHIPFGWSQFEAKITFNGALLKVTVKRTGERSLMVDGEKAEWIPDDEENHTILLTI